MRKTIISGNVRGVWNARDGLSFVTLTPENCSSCRITTPVFLTLAQAYEGKDVKITTEISGFALWKQFRQKISTTHYQEASVEMPYSEFKRHEIDGRRLVGLY